MGFFLMPMLAPLAVIVYVIEFYLRRTLVLYASDPPRRLFRLTATVYKRYETGGDKTETDRERKEQQREKSGGEKREAERKERQTEKRETEQETVIEREKETVIERAKTATLVFRCNPCVAHFATDAAERPEMI